MKKLSWFFVFAFMAYACQLQNADESVLSPEGLKSGAVVAEPEVCGEVMTFDLRASAQQVLVGSIKVSNDDEYLFVEFVTTTPETIETSHLNISCKVPTERGSPGQYTFASDRVDVENYIIEKTSSHHTYQIPKAVIGNLDCSSECFYLLAHVAMGSGETAMGNGCDGDTFTSGSGIQGGWFSYICYCWQECCKASGKVEKQLCEETPIPVAGVTVYFKQGITDRTTLTDELGKYEFKNIGTGDYKIWVDAYNYANPDPADYSGNCPTVPDRTNLNFIYNFYSIAGDVDKVVCEEPVKGEFTVSLSGRPTTKDPVVTSSSFLFNWLAAGTYTVTVPGATPQDVTLPGEPEVCVDDVTLRIDKYEVWGTLDLKDCEVLITGLIVDLYSNNVFINSYVTDTEGKFKFTELGLSGPFEVRFTYMNVPYAYTVTSCEDNTITIEIPCTPCYKDETGWSNGMAYPGKGGGWSTYTTYVGNSTVTLYAGQTMEAGTVHFSNPLLGKITITITLNQGWVFADVKENVKIQDYAVAPKVKPNVGQFMWKATASGSPFTIEVPPNNFYGVHVDLRKIIPCQ